MGLLEGTRTALVPFQMYAVQAAVSYISNQSIINF